jgi:hypothetical protein
VGLAWSVYNGRYESETEAAHAGDYKNVELNGEYAYLNFPADWPKERISGTQNNLSTDCADLRRLFSSNL